MSCIVVVLISVVSSMRPTLGGERLEDNELRPRNSKPRMEDNYDGDDDGDKDGGDDGSDEDGEHCRPY